MTPTEINREIVRLRQIANLMDAQFSIAGFRFGLDALLGLLPVAGDTAGGFVSLYLAWRSYQLGLSAQEVSLFLLFILADVFIGSIPVLGDIFDFFFKVNDYMINRVEKQLHKTT